MGNIKKVPTNNFINHIRDNGSLSNELKDELLDLYGRNDLLVKKTSAIIDIIKDKLITGGDIIDGIVFTHTYNENNNITTAIEYLKFNYDNNTNILNFIKDVDGNDVLSIEFLINTGGENSKKILYILKSTKEGIHECIFTF